MFSVHRTMNGHRGIQILLFLEEVLTARKAYYIAVYKKGTIYIISMEDVMKTSDIKSFDNIQHYNFLDYIQQRHKLIWIF